MKLIDCWLELFGVRLRFHVGAVDLSEARALAQKTATEHGKRVRVLFFDENSSPGVEVVNPEPPAGGATPRPPKLSKDELLWDHLGSPARGRLADIVKNHHSGKEDTMKNLAQCVRLYSPPHWDDAERQNQEAYEDNRSEWFDLQDELAPIFEINADLLAALKWLTNICCGVSRAGGDPTPDEVKVAIKNAQEVVARVET